MVLLHTIGDLINLCCFWSSEFDIISFAYFFTACSEGLGEGYDGDIAFASALEMFGGGHNDPISVAFGGRYSIF